MNRVFLIGNLTRDPEMRTTGSGLSVGNFTIAVNRKKPMGDGGTREQVTDYIPIVVWRGTAESCAKYLFKGSKVAVTGMIQTRSYETKEGDKRSITEVVADEVEFLTPARQQESRPPAEDYQDYAVTAKTPPVDRKTYPPRSVQQAIDTSDVHSGMTETDEDLPF